MVDESDKALFRSTVDSAAPLDKDAPKMGATQKTYARFEAYSYISEAQLSGSEVLNYARSGVSNKLIKKMQRGEIDYAPSIDLHGYTLTQTCQALSDFIYHHQNARFVHIIHGKGYNSENNLSVLKTQVASFLKQHPQVLAFHSCPAKDGGTGAVFVLLKNHV